MTTLSNFVVANQIFGNSPFQISPPTSNSSSPFSYSSSDPSILSISGDIATILHAGTVLITCSQDGVDISTSVVIQAKTVNITAANKSKTYNQLNPVLTYTIDSGYEDKIIVDNSVSVITTTAVQSSNVGTYSITFVSVQFTTVNADYSINFVDGTLTINAFAINISADNKSMTFGASVPSLTYTIAAGYSSYVVVDNSVAPIITSGTSSSNVGTYAITFNSGQMTTTSSNYSLNFINGTLTIDQVVINISADSKSMIFGASVPSLTYTIDSHSDKVVINNSVSVITTTGTSSSNVGTYSITLTQAQFTSSDSNYSLSFSSAVLTINAKEIIITADDQSKDYNTSNPTLTYGVSNDSSYVSVVNVGVATVTTSATTSSSVGTYSINMNNTNFAVTSSNFFLTFVSGTLTINAATLQISPSPLSTTYGDNSYGYSYQNNLGISTSGFLSGTPVYTVKDSSNNTVTPNGTTEPGTYTITITTGTLTNSNSNYTMVVMNTSANLVIQKRNTNVTATSFSQYYDNAVPTFTCSFSNLVNSDTISGSPSYTCSATQSSTVGVYPIIITIGTLSSSKYNFSFSHGSLTILKGIPLISYAPTPSSITFGTYLVDSQLTASASYHSSSVSGTWSFHLSTAAGTVLNKTTYYSAGTKTFVAVFTPTDSTNFETTNSSQTVLIQKIAPSFSWTANLVKIPYGLPLTTVQLNATAIDPILGESLGTIIYNHPLGSILDVGSQSITATLIVSNGNYTYQLLTAYNTIEVVPIFPKITYCNPRAISSGSALTNNEFFATTNLPSGVLNYDHAVGDVLNTDTNIVVELSPYNNSNFLTKTIKKTVIQRVSP